MMIEFPTGARMFLVFAHLMLCVFALREVLVADWQILHRGLARGQVAWLHRRIMALLAGLWITGLAIVAVDVGFDVTRLAELPKVLAKLVTVIVLTANGWLLHQWCFPRLERLDTAGFAERAAVMAAGATSTASWLVAAFLGIARPLKDAPLGSLLQLYGLALLAALAAALALALWRRPRRSLLAH